MEKLKISEALDTAIFNAESAKRTEAPKLERGYVFNAKDIANAKKKDDPTENKTVAKKHKFDGYLRNDCWLKR